MQDTARRTAVARSASIAISLSAVALLIGGCSDDEPTTPEARIEAITASLESPDGLPDGREVYNTTCATCHGTDGQGAIGPALGDGAVEANLTPIEHVTVVLNGRGTMPAWTSLSDDEIAAVVLYERESLGSD